MSQQQYMWMLGLMVAWRQQNDDDQDEPISPEMDEVVGVAGRLRQYERQASNEIAACQFILVLIRALYCANYSAKSVNLRPEICKFTGREIQTPETLNRALALAYVVAAWLLASVPFRSPPHTQRHPRQVFG